MAGQLHRGHGVEEAGRQAAQPAVAQTGVGLLFEHAQPVEAFVRDHALHLGSSSRLMTLFASERPIRNSIER